MRPSGALGSDLELDLGVDLRCRVLIATEGDDQMVELALRRLGRDRDLPERLGFLDLHGGRCSDVVGLLDQLAFAVSDVVPATPVGVDRCDERPDGRLSAEASSVLGVADQDVVVTREVRPLAPEVGDLVDGSGWVHGCTAER